MPSHLLVAALLAAGTGVVPAQAQDLCDRFRATADAGTVADTELTEISGLAASRAHPGVLWAHDDSGSEPTLSALDATGQPLGTYRVAGASAWDWEDLAAGPGPEEGRSYLYVGDIGDNTDTRETVIVYRVPEPTSAPKGPGGTLEGAAVIRLAYPDGPSNAESLFVDPRSGDLFIVTKEREESSARLLRAEAASLEDGATVPVQEVARVPLPGTLPPVLGLPTSADISPDGSIVLVRTYASVLAFARPEGEPVAEAFAQEPCEAPRPRERQGEALAFTADGDGYLTVSEGEAQAIHRFDVSARPGPAEADDESMGEEVVEEATRDGRPLRFALAAGAATLGAVAAIWATSRRRAGRRRTRASRRP